MNTLLLETVPLQYSSLSSILEACSSPLTILSLRVDVDGVKDVYDALAFDSLTYHAPQNPRSVVEASFRQEAFMRMVQLRRGLLRHSGDGERLRSLTLCAPYSSKPSEILNTLAELEEEGLAVEFHGYGISAHFETELGAES
ncbi:hypothetical protein IW262DRAFT_1468114 [Armillaria fumosa]|nr:hypothetical protein IW262DRAFT_1468114 [Armillaria fumosa]